MSATTGLSVGLLCPQFWKIL